MSEAFLPRPPSALYLHIPFCVSLCPYCDFVVYSGSATRGPRQRVAAFLVALRVELHLRADALAAAFGPPRTPARPPLATVYLGGGTPSLLAPAEVGALLQLVERRFGLARDAEVTLEANPGPDELGDLAGFRAAGVTRLSLGAQALDGAALRRIGRRHRPGDVVEAVRRARAARFRSLSLDLLYDLPGQPPGSFAETVERALELAPDHVSAYALTLDDPDAEGLTGPSGDHLPVRRGAHAWRTRAAAEQDADRATDAYALLDARLAAAGFAGYEISNWARPGHESRHNLAYWRRLPYEAVGPGAHAFDGARTRRWNAARLEGYLGALHPPDGGSPRLPPGGSERLDDATIRSERVILGLRLAGGVAGGLMRAPGVAEALAWGSANGLLERRAGGRLALTLRGRLLSNELFARLV
ncbi:MAG: coproporphyrinogen-III oxidase family protein [Candidatus Limnocylindrales bacterium]